MIFRKTWAKLTGGVPIVVYGSLFGPHKTIVYFDEHKKNKEEYIHENFHNQIEDIYGNMRPVVPFKKTNMWCYEYPVFNIGFAYLNEDGTIANNHYLTHWEHG